VPEEEALEAVLETIDRAWEAGSPIARCNDRQVLATTALRRWRSFDRRTRIKRPTLDDRVEDLAKGLRDACEPDPHLTGPLMEDYRHLARAIAAAL
jgi:hypothetical protein